MVVAKANQNNNIISERYASALFDLAVEKKAISDVSKDVAAFSKVLQENAELKITFANPTILKAEKLNVVVAIAKKLGNSKLFTDFIKTLADNNRLNCLAEIFEQYNAKVIKQSGEIKATIITANKISKKSLDDVAKSIEKAFGKKIVAEHVINTDILGGVMVKVGSKLLDYSLKGKLQRLETSLAGNIAGNN